LSDSSLGDGVKPLIEVLSKTKLRSINLSKNQINSENASALLKSLATNEGIQEIFFDNNLLDEAVVPTLIEEIPKLEKLKVVNLSDNKFGDAGAIKLAEGLQSATLALSALQLSGNDIGNAGATAIGNFIAKNKSVSRILLSSNKISDDGAKEIAKALAENDLIDELDFSNNNIGNKGAIYLKKSLKGHKSILNVNLSGNKKITGGSDLNELLLEGFTFPELSFQRA